MMTDNNPFYGLTPFHKGNEHMFLGRDKQINELMELIVRNHYVLLYGQAGIGKTSLINAGIIPQAKDMGWIPVCVRLMTHDDCPNYSIQIIHSIEETINQIGGFLERECPLSDNDRYNLAEYFEGLHVYNKNTIEVPILIIFDQLEDIFTRSKFSNKHSDYIHMLFSEFDNIIYSENVRKRHNEAQEKKVFISYKRGNLNPVKKLKKQIEQSTGINCWMDLEGIESDAQFTNVIIKAINDADVFLFMYSNLHANIVDFENDWTIRELAFAQNKKKRIVFINIDGTPLTDYFNFRFGTKQQVDTFSERAIIRLFHDLKNWIKPTKENNGSIDDTETKTCPSEIHLLFSMRDNYLSKFEQEVKNIPALQHNHFFLRGFNKEEASLVIKNCSFVNDNDVVQLIIDIVLDNYNIDSSYDADIEIDPTTLSLFLSVIRQQCYERGLRYATKKLINSFDANNAIFIYYKQSTSAISKNTLSLLERELVDAMGNRTRVSFHTLLAHGAKKLEIDHLRSLHVIIFVFWDGQLYIELANDLLCIPIMKKRTSDDTLTNRF